MYFQKTEILKGRGVHDYGILTALGGGLTHFGISEGEGGLKHGSRPWLGMDIFWNCPIIVYIMIKKAHKVSRILPYFICKSNQFSACF